MASSIVTFYCVVQRMDEITELDWSTIADDLAVVDEDDLAVISVNDHEMVTDGRAVITDEYRADNADDRFTIIRDGDCTMIVAGTLERLVVAILHSGKCTGVTGSCGCNSEVRGCLGFTENNYRWSRKFVLREFFFQKRVRRIYRFLGWLLDSEKY
jgi:hypothetical protein